MSPRDVLRERPARLIASGKSLALLIVILLYSPRPAEADAGPATRPVNDRCPVMTDEAASPLHEITFHGAAVRFCCARCKDRFLLEPQAYLARLPHVPPEAPADPGAPGAKNRGGFDVWRLVRQAELFVKGATGPTASNTITINLNNSDTFHARWSLPSNSATSAFDHRPE